MKAYVNSVSVSYHQGDFTTIDLRLIVADEGDLSELCDVLKPGARQIKLGIGDASTKETKLSLPRGRKLFLDKT